MARHIHKNHTVSTTEWTNRFGSNAKNGQWFATVSDLGIVVQGIAGYTIYTTPDFDTEYAAAKRAIEYINRRVK